MQTRTSLLSKVGFGVLVAIAASAILFIAPLTNNFITDSKTYSFFFLTAALILVYLARSVQKRTLEMVWSPFTLPLLLFGGAILTSSLLTSSYPTESLLGFGGIFLAGLAVVLFGSPLLKENQARAIVPALGIVGVLLTISSGLQLVGFGPSALFNHFFGTELPSTLIFNLASNSFAALQVLVVIVAGLIAQIIATKHISKLTSVVLPIVVIGVVLHGWSILPKQVAAVALPSFNASWSVALDAIREPRSAIIGVGPAMYSNAYLKYKPQWVNGTESWNITFSQASNAPLYLLTISGFFGLITWGLLAFRILKRTTKTSPEGRALAIMMAVTILLQLVLPFNIVMVVIQAVILTALIASEKNSFSVIKLKAPSIAFIMESQEGLKSKSGSAGPIFAMSGLLLLGIGVLTYFVGRAYAAELMSQKGNVAAATNDGVAVYENHRRAVELNPYLDYHHRQYALTNMLIAVSLSNKADITEEEQTQVGNLLQQAVREAQSATTLDPTDVQNWAVLAQIYQNMVGVTPDAEQWTTQSYVSAIQNDPTNPNLRITLGGFFLGLEPPQLQQAASLFQQATELKPDMANAHYNFAYALVQLNQLEQAKAEYEAVLALLDPESEDYAAVAKELEPIAQQVADLQAQQQEQANAQGLQEGIPVQTGQQTQPSIVDQNINNGQNFVTPPGEDVDLTQEQTAPPAEPVASEEPQP